MKRETIKLAPYMVNTHPSEVLATVAGTLAAHKVKDKRGWTITHVPTGTSLRSAFVNEWQPLTGAQAKALIAAMNERFPDEMATLAELEFNPQKLGAEARKALQRLAEAKGTYL